MAFEPFATLEDYEEAYRVEPSEADAVSALLRHASLRLDSELATWRPGYARGADATYDEKLALACVMMAHDAMTVPEAALGATSYSQGVGGYTASVTYGAARGVLSLTRPVMELLGFGGQAVGSLAPLTGEDR